MAQTEKETEIGPEHSASGSPNGAVHPAPAGMRGRLQGLRRKLSQATLDNPVLVKEFRTRMRGTRAYWILLGYTLLIASILAFIYYLHESSVSQMAAGEVGGARGAQDLGRAMYYTVFIAQAIMVALITPAITAGSITIEREQRSYELLVTTPLRPVDLIRGKLSAAVSFVLLLLTASLPLVSLSFLVGGVSPAEILFSYVIIGLCAFAYGSVGIFWSAALKSTATATVVTYLTVVSFFLLTLFPGMVGVGGSGTGAVPEMPFQSINPVMATFRAVQPEYVLMGEVPSWVSASVVIFLFGLMVTIQAMTRLEHFEPPKPGWPRFVATLLWSSTGLFLLGAPYGGVLRNLTGNIGTRANETMSILLISVMVLICLVIPILNTGDLVVRRGENVLARYLKGFLPFRMLRDDLSCGLPLTFLWLAVVLAVIPLGAMASGKAGSFNFGGVFVPGVVLCVSVVFGFAGIGNVLSVTLPSRWAAAILTYLAMVLTLLLPYFVLAPWGQTGTVSPSPAWNLLYLVPFEGLGELASPASFWNNRLPLAIRPIWIVTATLYFTVGLVCFAVTMVRVRSVSERLQARMAVS